MSQPTPHSMHLGIAENGKIRALAGDHAEALRHYREALRLAVSAKAPEVFFRHYTQCVMESLEHTKSFGEIIRYCEEADAHYRSLNLSGSLYRRDHGAILERLGIAHLKASHLTDGREALARAVAVAGESALPLAAEILGWLGRGYTIDGARLHRSQVRHGYFIVRPDRVDRARARALPPLPPEAPAFGAAPGR